MLTKLRCLAHVLANIEPDGTDQQAEEEWHAPSPAFELVGSEPAEQDNAEERGEHRGKSLTEPLKARKKTFAVWRMFDQESCRAAEFAGHCEALQQPARSTATGARIPTVAVGRHNCHQAGTDRHDDDRKQHRGAPPGSVGIGAEHKGTEWPHEIGNPERAERQKQRRRRIGGGEKQFRNRDGEIAVDKNVVPFECIADRGRGKNFERAGLMPHSGRGGC